MKNINKYGLKIKNFEAATLLEYSKGLRDHYEYKNAMFVNSLFLDFLKDNGLKHNGETTRDIICIEFNYGTRSYEQELSHLHKIAQNAHKEYYGAYMYNNEHMIDVSENKKNKITDLLFTSHKNQKIYQSKTKEDIRVKYYNDGLEIKYITHDKYGNVKKEEIIFYKMLFRSTGKAKKGSCMFIRDKLYKKAKKYLYMDIKLPKKNPMIVEISAYAPLVASGIVGKIHINPRNILVLKDIDKFFKTDIVSIEIDEHMHCVAKDIENYSLKNTMFDGQALIDSSKFPAWGNGYVLLRQHFCKMAAFNANIQLFFKDYFGDKYETATVKDMFGVEHCVKDIELITTDNALKYLKFDVSYDYWCKKVEENGCMFGVVKTAHPSKLGNKQRMSYQMVNSLSEEIMPDVVKDSIEYVNQLKTNNNIFLDYLKKNSNFSNDYDVLIALCKHNPDFVRSSYFRERKKKIIQSYVLRLKNGEILQNAENLTIVGSPYAMLLYAASGKTEIVDMDNTFTIEKGTIQCFTERFENNEYLAGFRSPFNSKNNLIYLHNVYSERMFKYFNFGKQIIAVNMNGTDFQDRANGSDQDSDFLYTTNQADIVNHAKWCYKNYHTIVNNVPKEKNTYSLSMDSYAFIDNKLAKSQLDIGESSNLAQIAQTYSYSFPDKKKYDDYASCLATLAQIAIDSAKRLFAVDVQAEIKRIKKEMNLNENKYPEFWKIIKRDFSKNNINSNLSCPMNYLAKLDLNKYRETTSTIPINEFLKTDITINKKNRKTCKKVEELIEKYALSLTKSKIQDSEIENEQYLLLRSDFEDLVKEIQKIHFSFNYIEIVSCLINWTFENSSQNFHSKKTKSKLNRNRPILLKILYEANPKVFLSCFY